MVSVPFQSGVVCECAVLRRTPAEKKHQGCILLDHVAFQRLGPFSPGIDALTLTLKGCVAFALLRGKSWVRDLFDVKLERRWLRRRCYRWMGEPRAHVHQWL